MVKTEQKERTMRSGGNIGTMPIGVGMREMRSKKQKQQDEVDKALRDYDGGGHTLAQVESHIRGFGARWLYAARGVSKKAKADPYPEDLMLCKTIGRDIDGRIRFSAESIKYVGLARIVETKVDKGDMKPYAHAIRFLLPK